MDLKALCKSYTWQGVTFWMLGYRNASVDIAINDLEAVEPRWVYVNKQTGEQSQEKPAALVKAEDNWDKLRVPEELRKSEWETHGQWTMLHNVFVLALPLMVHIDFPDPDIETSSEVRMFELFWRERFTDTAERWKAYYQIVSTGVVYALWEAYRETRDHILEAPTALQQAPTAEDDAEKKDVAPTPNSTSSPSSPSKRKRK